MKGFELPEENEAPLLIISQGAERPILISQTGFRYARQTKNLVLSAVF